jgi:lambda repressor-like predicted transcriptional regulator
MTTAAQRHERAESAARLRAAGWSLRQIARHLRVADSTVRADLRDAPAPLRPYPLAPPFAGDWRAKAEQFRAAGHPDHRRSQPMPFWMIAERLSVPERDVRRHFARLRSRESRADRALWLRTAGQSLREIAASLGVSEATVRRDLADRPVRHLPARKTRIVPAAATGIAHPDDAAPAVIPLRRRNTPTTAAPEGHPA